MNERIQELVEQARVQDRGYFIYQYGGPTGHQSVEKAIDLEKFAELIVQECVAIVDDAERGGSNEIWDNAVKFIKRDLLEHFGVEE
jgi:hypothetical protein